MKGFASLVLGIFGTFAFSWVGLILVPNFQIGHLDPQSDEEGTDIYPMPISGMADRGREIYAANGCAYCHTQQVRADYAASDIDRKWGERRSAPRDYVFARPPLLGKMRMGPDLSNVGKRAPAEAETAPPSASPAASAGPSPGAASSPAAGANPSPAAAGSPAAPTNPSPSAPTSSPAKTAASPAAPTSSPAPSAAPAALAGTTSPSGQPAKYSEAWHHQHLYSPRSLSIDSNMPAYRFLYEKRLVTAEVSADALKLTGPDAPPDGWEIVPTYDAECLVAYLMSLDQSHPLKEVKSVASAASPAAAPASSPGTQPAASPSPSPVAGKAPK
jgi:cytochrome c oxidase cbb3-type subunit 2